MASERTAKDAECFYISWRQDRLCCECCEVGKDKYSFMSERYIKELAGGK